MLYNFWTLNKEHAPIDFKRNKISFELQKFD